MILLNAQDHMYGIPMVDVKWHTGPGGERRVISSDSRIAKIWCEHAYEAHCRFLCADVSA